MFQCYENFKCFCIQIAQALLIHYNHHCIRFLMVIAAMQLKDAYSLEEKL